MLRYMLQTGIRSHRRPSSPPPRTCANASTQLRASSGSRATCIQRQNTCYRTSILCWQSFPQRAKAERRTAKTRAVAAAQPAKQHRGSPRIKLSQRLRLPEPALPVPLPEQEEHKLQTAILPGNQGRGTLHRRRRQSAAPAPIRQAAQPRSGPP